MMEKMGKQEFKEMMAEAKEAEREETIAEQVEVAIKDDAGKEITRLAEPKRSYTRRKKASGQKKIEQEDAEVAAARIGAIKTAIIAMSENAEEAIKISKGYMRIAEDLMAKIDVLEGMIK